MTKLWPFDVHVPKWHLAYFVPIDGHFEQIGRYILYRYMDFKFVLPSSYIKLAILSQKILQNITKMAISQTPL